MDRSKSLEIFQNETILKAVLSNIIPAIISMIMVLLSKICENTPSSIRRG